MEVASAEWKTFNFEFERPCDKDEIHLMCLWPTANSKIDIDDMYLAPK